MSEPIPTPSRLATARVILSRRQLRAALRLNPAAARRITVAASFQAGVSVLSALLLTHASPWPHLAGFTALGALVALFGRFEPLRRRLGLLALVGAMLTGAVALTSIAGLVSQSVAVTISAVGIVAGLATAICLARTVGAPGAVIIVFAAGAAIGPTADAEAVGARALAVAAGAALGWFICLVSDRARPTVSLPHAAAAAIGTDGTRPAQISALKRLWIPAGRAVLAAAPAGVIAHLLGWPHPAWAAIGATAVLQGTHLGVHMDRALQRASGTAVGALVAWPLLLLDMPFWGVALTVAVLQFATELIIGRNYAIGQITVTPMALLLTELASPSPGSAMPAERVFETLLGVAVGIVIAVALSDRESRHHLTQIHRFER